MLPLVWSLQYYDTRRIFIDFGPTGINGYRAPKEKLRGSILSLSSTGGGGRGSAEGHIVGDVINHGKRKYWGRGLDFFYHNCLRQGENTLEGQLARVALRSLAKTGAFQVDAFLAVSFKCPHATMLQFAEHYP